MPQPLKRVLSGVDLPTICPETWDEEPLQKQKNQHRIHLSVYEAERYCALDLSHNPLARETQRKVAKWLAHYFKRGGRETPADKWKAETYAALSDDSLTQEDIIKKITALNEWNLKRTQTWYALLGWFTSTRLLLSRSNRVAQLLGKFVKTKLLAIGGFSYGIELIIDIGIILKHIFKPDEGEKQLPWLLRAKNAFMKDARWYRILNAAVWFAINVTTFIITGGTSAILNLCGFSFDPINEALLSWSELSKNKQLLHKLDDKLGALDKKLTHLANHNFIKYKAVIAEKNDIELQLAILNQKLTGTKFSLANLPLFDEKHDLEQKLKSKMTQINSLTKTINLATPRHLLDEYIKTTLEKTKLEKTIHNLTLDRIHTVCVVLGVLAGTALFLFPPAGIPAMVGAILVLAAGSVMGGFCRRVYNRRNEIKSCFCTQKTASVTPSFLTDHAQKRISRVASSPNIRIPSTLGHHKPYAQLQLLQTIEEKPEIPRTLSDSAFFDKKALEHNPETSFLSTLTPLASTYTPSVSN